ncbi:Lpg1974 family pore-forming outer membrane protein [Mesorhizobium sp. GbtcB19]|uniref:Lpg1974 family pore-forming outer membrane protein n=1 Tax=Mesorhizobium sp. GbtcB19 TaxID=2824764 RepID=UPI001C2F7D66|nr:Lpg1974 family pore-forming outer membrane protein [Mesorhizobium sp. GbtcB19]
MTSVGVATAHATEAQVTDPSVIDSRIKIAFEGAVFQNNVHSDKTGLGGSDKLGNANGDLYGSIALTKQISPDVDWRLAGAFHTGKDRSWDFNASTPTEAVNFNYGDDFNFQTLDFDLGKHVKMQAADIRFFGGLRLVHSKEHIGIGEGFSETSPVDKSGSADKLGKAEYWGIGPHVGVEGYYPLGEKWGLTGSASGAVMWGRRTETVSFDVVSDNPNNTPAHQEGHFSQSQHSNETVTSFDASAGISWTPFTNTTFTAGYKVEQWHNLLVTADKKTSTFNGPFLRLEVKM